MSDFWRNLMLTVIAACAVVWTGLLLYVVKQGGSAVDAVTAAWSSPDLDARLKKNAENERILEEMKAAMPTSRFGEPDAEPGEGDAESK